MFGSFEVSAFLLPGLSQPSITLTLAGYGAMAVLLAGWFWVIRKRWTPTLALAPLLLITALSLVRIVITSGADADEVEHLHLSWLLTQGRLPYRDIHQTHTPLLWLLAAPLIKLLPESAYILFIFRTLAVTAYGLTLWIACKLVCEHPNVRADEEHLSYFRPPQPPLNKGGLDTSHPPLGNGGLETSSPPLTKGGVGGVCSACCVLLALIYAVESQVYRFRPDPFMMLAALGSVFFALRIGGPRPVLASYLSGILLGLAIAFSPKVGLLTLVFAAACISKALRSRRWSDLALSLPYAGGLGVAVVPVLAWMAWHGLFAEAGDSIVGENAELAVELVTSYREPPNAELVSLLAMPRFLNLAPLIVLAVIGSFMALRKDFDRDHHSGLPYGRLLVSSFLLLLAFLAVAPNYLTYHMAPALIFAAILAAPVLRRILVWGTHGLRPLVVAALLALGMGNGWWREGIGGHVDGATARLADIDELLEVVRSRGGTCVCIMPHHPIFAHDAGEVYLNWDRFSPRWSATVDRILQHPPGVVLDHNWRSLVQHDRLSQRQFAQLRTLFDERYESRLIGGKNFRLRRN